MRRKKCWMTAFCMTLCLGLLAGCREGNKAQTPVAQNDIVTEQSGTTEAADDQTAEGTEEMVQEEPEDVSATKQDPQEVLEALLQDTVDPAQRQALEQQAALTKILGRVYMMDGTVWCGLSGSGVEFEYTGKQLDITIVGDGTVSGDQGHQARVGIYVDGERVVDDQIDAKEETYHVVNSKQEKTVVVTIVKLSEAANSLFGIRPIEIGEGESIVPTPAKAHRIEFIGDSITCGYGVDDEVKENHFSTATEDVTKAYAYKTAQLLDADYSIVSYSGYGVISGYTNDPSKKAGSQTLPQYYDKVGFSYQVMGSKVKPQSVYWDFAQFAPEAIVVNLGTNDDSYVKSDVGKRLEYTEGYQEFLKKIRLYNPDAEIFCALGVMGQGLYTPMEIAVKKYIEETGDERVHAIKLPNQDGSLGYAADWHPTEATHTKTAQIVADEINKIMYW